MILLAKVSGHSWKFLDRNVFQKCGPCQALYLGCSPTIRAGIKHPGPRRQRPSWNSRFLWLFSRSDGAAVFSLLSCITINSSCVFGQTKDLRDEIPELEKIVCLPFFLLRHLDWPTSKEKGRRIMRPHNRGVLFASCRIWQRCDLHPWPLQIAHRKLDCSQRLPWGIQAASRFRSWHW